MLVTNDIVPLTFIVIVAVYATVMRRLAPEDSQEPPNA